MLNWRVLKLVLVLVLTIELATADTGRGYHHYGRRGIDGDSERDRMEKKLEIQHRNTNKTAVAVEYGILRVGQRQGREGSDTIPAAPRTASDTAQSAASPTINKRVATTPSIPSTTPPPRLQPRQAITLDPVGTISSLSASLSSLSSSASSAISNISAFASSVQKSASSAQSSALSSASSSASVAIASLSASASSAVSTAASSAIASVSMALSSAWSAVESARSEVATARAQASAQIQQAEGAVVSVTQAALGIVGAIIGSSILSILTFYCVMRWRKQKKKERLAMSRDKKPSIGYPQPSPLNGLDPGSFTASPARTVYTPRKFQSTRARSMIANSAPPRLSHIDTSRASEIPQVGNEPPSPMVDPGFLSPGTTIMGYATSDYASQEWPAFPEQPGSGNTTMVRTPSSSSNAPNFSRRHTRADSAPSSSLGLLKTENGPSVYSTYVPGHGRSRSASTSTLGGIGVAGDLRSPLRRNVVSIYPRPRAGGGVVLVRPENRTSSNGGMKEAPLPPPPSFDKLDRLSRISEEPGNTSFHGVPPLELKSSGKVSPFEWP